MVNINNILLMRIYTYLCIALDRKVPLSKEDALGLFNKLIVGDIYCMRSAPINEEMDKELQIINQQLSLLKNTKQYSEKVLQNKVADLINAHFDVINYEYNESELTLHAKDVLYYRAVLAQYKLENILLSGNDDMLIKFTNEFSSLANIFALYFKSVDEKKVATAKLLKGKVEDIFKRYDFHYSLPNCCII